MLLAALVVATLGTAPLAAQRAGRLPPPPWPAELGEAFELYYAGEFLEVQRACQQLSAGTRDQRLHRQAAALAAMATMRLPGRADRLSGRAQLSQLAEEDASLLTRPECQLAYGLAQTALNETATALHHLNQAARAFADRGQPNRLAEACVALAEAWARHGEWELTVPDLEIPRPENRAAADRIRQERIRALRERVAALPGSDTYLARIDLVLARHLVEIEESAAEGLALLEDLARREETTTTIAQACLTLAERYEAARRWSDAARLYARVQAARLGELSRLAEQRRSAIQRPQLDLEVPAQVAAGERVAVKLGVRNLAAIEFEVRRVDLASWLERRQGRFAEAALPTSGALVAVRNLSTGVTAEHDWWRAETLDEPLTFEAPAGALVASVRSADGAGRTVISKRLVLVGNLRATVFIGRRRVAIWATRVGQVLAGAGEAEPQARFWMHGSFVPARPPFTAGVAVFALPPEARLLRDKRWVCLVQAGEQVTLCHGTLPTGAGDPQHKPAVALIGGPPQPRVGGQLHVFGLLLGGSSDRTAGRPPKPVELELLNALDRVLNTATAAVSSARTFTARLPITPSMAGEHLRVAVRLDGHVLENVFSRPSVHVTRTDPTSLRVRCDLPRWLPPAHRGVVGQIEAAYPWGTAIFEALAVARFRAVRLPTMQPKREPVYSHAFSRKFRLDTEGKREFVQPFSDFHLPPGPLAVGVWVDATGWDDRFGLGSAEVLIGPEPVHLWLRCDTDVLRVGEPLRVSVGWFDPTGRAAGARPTVEVWRDGAPLTHLKLLPAVSGLRSQTWRPTAPGPYELVAKLPLNQGEPVTVRDTVHVAGRRTNEQELTPVRCEARFTRHARGLHVHVRLDGQRRHPVLTLLEAGDPLIARQLPSLDGATELLLPLAGRPRAATRLVLAALHEVEVQILTVAEVQPADEDALTLALSGDLSDSAPGATVAISVTCLRARQPAQDATLVARLVDASRSGGVQWLPGEGRSDLALLPGGIHIASSAAAGTAAEAFGGSPDVIPETRELSAQLALALFDRPTLWVDSQPARDGAATFHVPLPPKPGLYRLVITVQTPDGGFTSETLDLDTRRGIQLTADVPEHLTLGDRSVASLIITNAEPIAARIRVIFEGGPGLQADEWRLLDRQTRLESSDDGASFALPLPPLSSATLRASIEAAQPGTGTAVFAVETERTRQRATASYTIYPTASAEPQATSRETVVVRRSLFLLEEEEFVADDDALVGEGVSVAGQPQWLRLAIEPGARISPGQLVLVQEEFSLRQALRQVEWQQRLPGNCYTHAGDWDELRQIGTRRNLRLEAVTRHITRLAAGRWHTHEYVIVAVRPGACRFPPPVVCADGVPVRVEVKPAAQHVLVTDSN
ncbi:MAG: hypothetical protein ACE5I3_12770 [Phycisphaerae bacterium]